MTAKTRREPRPTRHFPEDDGAGPTLVAARRDARRAGQRAAQAAYQKAYRHELALTRARAPDRGLPGERPNDALGALTEAYHRRYDSAHPGSCRGCSLDALRLLAFLPDPWRLTDDPAAPSPDAYTLMRHGLDADLLVLLPTPWRLVADRSLPRAVLDDAALDRLLWDDSPSLFMGFETRGAPGEPMGWEDERERTRAEMRTAAAAGRQPDLTREGPTLSVRRFVLRLWAQARREHWRVDDPFMTELRCQLVDLRDNPYGGRRR